MEYQQFFEYNGETSFNYGLIVQHFIKMPTGLQKITTYDIPGRDGMLYEKTGAYDEVTIAIDVIFRNRDSLHANEQFRQLKRWLLADGDNELLLSDDPGWFFKVQNVEISDKEILFKKRSEDASFTITFTCLPYTYMIAGKNEYSPEDVAFNPYSVCHPIYLIEGSGRCTLTVNGTSVSVTIDDNIAITTDLEIATREGLFVLAADDTSVLVNSDGTGLLTDTQKDYYQAYTIDDYESLYLQEGDNEISISSGFSLKIIPNWRAL